MYPSFLRLEFTTLCIVMATVVMLKVRFFCLGIHTLIRELQQKKQKKTNTSTMNFSVSLPSPCLCSTIRQHLRLLYNCYGILSFVKLTSSFPLPPHLQRLLFSFLPPSLPPFCVAVAVSGCPGILSWSLSQADIGDLCQSCPSQ